MTWSITVANADAKHYNLRRLITDAQVPPNYVYVGRISRSRNGGTTIPASILANRFVGKEYTLDTALCAYYDWISKPTPEVEAELVRIAQLDDPIVLCWCPEPTRCHAFAIATEVIKRREDPAS